MNRYGCALRRRYGRTHGAGHIEAALVAGGRWAITLKGTPDAGPIYIAESRSAAITQAQKEAKKRGIPFVMGI